MESWKNGRTLANYDPISNCNRNIFIKKLPLITQISRVPLFNTQTTVNEATWYWCGPKCQIFWALDGWPWATWPWSIWPLPSKKPHSLCTIILMQSRQRPVSSVVIVQQTWVRFTVRSPRLRSRSFDQVMKLKPKPRCFQAIINTTFYPWILAICWNSGKIYRQTWFENEKCRVSQVLRQQNQA